MYAFMEVFIKRKKMLVSYLWIALNGLDFYSSCLKAQLFELDTLNFVNYNIDFWLYIARNFNRQYTSSSMTYCFSHHIISHSFLQAAFLSII